MRPRIITAAAREHDGTGDDPVRAYQNAMRAYEAARTGSASRVDAFVRLLVAERASIARSGRMDRNPGAAEAPRVLRRSEQENAFAACGGREFAVQRRQRHAVAPRQLEIGRIVNAQTVSAGERENLGLLR